MRRDSRGSMTIPPELDDLLEELRASPDLEIFGGKPSKAKVMEAIILAVADRIENVSENEMRGVLSKIKKKERAPPGIPVDKKLKARAAALPDLPLAKVLGLTTFVEVVKVPLRSMFAESVPGYSTLLELLALTPKDIRPYLLELYSNKYSRTKKLL